MRLGRWLPRSPLHRAASGNSASRPIRVLFIHASWSSTPEYRVQRILAQHSDPASIACCFVWQDSVHHRAVAQSMSWGAQTQHVFYDFGRDTDTEPQPSRLRRAWMVAGRFPLSLLVLARVTRDFKPDLVYTSQQRLDVALASAVRLVTSIPHVVHLHYHVGPWLGRVTYRTIRNTPRLIACSDFIRSSAVDAGCAPDRIRVIHNPADVDRFSVATDGLKVRREFGWTSETPVVVSLGALEPRKGHSVLLSAFRDVHAVRPDARLLIVGPPRYGRDHALHLERMARDMGLEEAVVFAGGRPDAPDVLAAGDVFALASRDEPFGLAYVEAMLMGLPIVACRSGGAAEIVVDGETGLLCDPSDASQMADDLLQLLGAPGLARAMGERGRQRALESFAPPVLARKWLQVLRQAALPAGP